jgi:hypothetical protein
MWAADGWMLEWQAYKYGENENKERKESDVSM